VDVEKRLLRDAESFAGEVVAFDQERFIGRVLLQLGLYAEESASSDDVGSGGVSTRPPDPTSRRARSATAPNEESRLERMAER